MPITLLVQTSGHGAQLQFVKVRAIRGAALRCVSDETQNQQHETEECRQRSEKRVPTANLGTR